MWRSILRFLRDPMHQGISVVIAIVALTLTLWPSRPKGQISIRTIYAVQLAYPIAKSPDGLEIRFGDIKVQMEDVSLHFVEISNDTTRAITPTDVISPITVETLNSERIISASTSTDGGMPAPKWKELTPNRWQLETPLLNPGDKLRSHFTTFRTPESKGAAQLSVLQWTARIVNTPIRVTTTPITKLYEGPFAEISIRYQGVHLGVLLFFVVYLQYLLLKSAVKTKLLLPDLLSSKRVFFFFSALGISGGEVIAHVWTNPPENLATISWIVLGLYVAALVWMRFRKPPT